MVQCTLWLGYCCIGRDIQHSINFAIWNGLRPSYLKTMVRLCTIQMLQFRSFTVFVARSVSLVSGILFSVYIMEPLKATVLAFVAVMRHRKVDVTDWIPPLTVSGTLSYIHSTNLCDIPS